MRRPAPAFGRPLAAPVRATGGRTIGVIIGTRPPRSPSSSSSRPAGPGDQDGGDDKSDQGDAGGGDQGEARVAPGDHLTHDGLARNRHRQRGGLIAITTPAMTMKVATAMIPKLAMAMIITLAII